MKKIILTIIVFIFINVLFISSVATNELKIFFIDVGQADCLLIQTPSGNNVLIDAGNIEDIQSIISYIYQQGVHKLDVIIATHPHADHIGGMAQVINKFEIGKIYMPYASNNTATFRDLLLAIKEKGLKISTAKSGIKIDLDPVLEMIFIAPNNNSYANLNDYSAVLKIIYKKTSFLLVGDASVVSEEEMIKSEVDLKADILKVGHHGSNSSTSERFLEKVSPKYAVISVGSGNSYGHPASETLRRLARYKVTVFRTDLDGSLIIVSDGESIRIDKQSSPIKPKAPPLAQYLSNKPNSSAQTDNNSATVYITRTGKKYHRLGCRYLSKSCVPIDLKKAKDLGYLPCKVCKPPN